MVITWHFKCFNSFVQVLCKSRLFSEKIWDFFEFFATENPFQNQGPVEAAHLQEPSDFEKRKAGESRFAVPPGMSWMCVWSKFAPIQQNKDNDASVSQRQQHQQKDFEKKNPT